ncbi:MAG: NAD-dependent epimerase/dehydratase family protein [Ruminococcus sp.]|nr:NAD-dependent epimerase/dehydratase family protein [Ruminococcus sp.]
MNILVTGGTVFASRFTAEYFIEKGHNVYVLNRGNDEQSVGALHIKADRHSLGDTLKKYRFDAVLDVTAYNAQDVKDLIDGLGEFGTYVLVSSSAVYPETLSQPFRENDLTGPNSIWGAYGTDKIAAEKYVEENISDHYIIRPPYLYGPMNNVYREAFVFECAERNMPFYLPKDGSMPLQFFHIRDMCRFMEILITKKPFERIYNVGDKKTVSIKEWVNVCYEVCGKTPEFVSVSGDVPQRSYFPFYDYAYTLDVSRQDKLMPDKMDLQVGLEESLQWYMNNKKKVKTKPFLSFIENNLT